MGVLLGLSLPQFDGGGCQPEHLVKQFQSDPQLTLFGEQVTKQYDDALFKQLSFQLHCRALERTLRFDLHLGSPITI